MYYVLFDGSGDMLSYTRDVNLSTVSHVQIPFNNWNPLTQIITNVAEVIAYTDKYTAQTLIDRQTEKDNRPVYLSTIETLANDILALDARIAILETL